MKQEYIINACSVSESDCNSRKCTAIKIVVADETNPNLL